MMSLTGPQTLDVHSAGVENSSAIGRLPSTWLNDTACMSSGGMRFVSSVMSQCTVASVLVSIAGGRWPTAGIGKEAATAISLDELIRPCGARVNASSA